MAADDSAARKVPLGKVPSGAAAPPRPYVDLPVSLGRLRTLRGWQVLSVPLFVGWVFLAVHPQGLHEVQCACSHVAFRALGYVP
jgi:hypothetical protein